MVPAEEVYELEAIVAHKKEHGKYYYKIRWKGYGPEDDTWEPSDNIHNTVSIANYWERLGQTPTQQHLHKTDSHANGTIKRYLTQRNESQCPKFQNKTNVLEDIINLSKTAEPGGR